MSTSHGISFCRAARFEPCASLPRTLYNRCWAPFLSAGVIARTASRSMHMHHILPNIAITTRSEGGKAAAPALHDMQLGYSASLLHSVRGGDGSCSGRLRLGGARRSFLVRVHDRPVLLVCSSFVALPASIFRELSQTAHHIEDVHWVHKLSVQLSGN